MIIGENRLPLMVSISGIRGIIGESLTPEMIVKYVSAFAEYSKFGTVVIGRDGRITGNALSEIVASILRLSGGNVIDIGIVPTPTVQIAIEKLKASGGIAITASHNPIEWNGLKFLSSSGLFLNAEENLAFWKIANTGSPRYVSWNHIGTYSQDSSMIDFHIKSILSLPYINIEKIRKRNYKIILDCVNSAGGNIVPKLLKEFGCSIVELNCDVSGVFAHTPEPIPENLTQLCDAVKKYKADFGIAVDPDVDRLVLIDEKGEPYSEEYTIATVVKFILSKEKPNQHVVINLSTTRAVDDIAAKFSANVFRTPVGEINVATKMKELGAIIGGEGSGGVILPKIHIGRDAPIGIALILQMLAEFNGTLSELKLTLPQYSIVKGKVNVTSIDSDTAFRRIQQLYSNEGKVNTSDGVKIDFATSWIHLRKSNTEPIVRIIAEAPTKIEAEALVTKFTNEIKNINNR